MSATSQVSEVVEQYLDAFYRGDFESPGTLLADDLSFKGAFVEVDGADQFLASAEGLRRIVKGHRTIRQWHDGEELSTLYEMKLETPAGKGSVLVSECNTVRGNKIARRRWCSTPPSFGSSSRRQAARAQP